MSFLLHSLNFYRRALQALREAPSTPETIYRARQLLKLLDDRADMRMNTTYPYLANLYAPRVYTARYEENQLFETMVSQEAYLRYSSFRNGRFYVQKCTSADIERLSLSEIKAMQTKEDANA